MLQIYCIYDKVAEEFGPLYLAVNDGVAVRNYAKLLNEVVDTYDYALYCLGMYDVKKGRIKAYKKPQEVFVHNDGLKNKLEVIENDSTQSIPTSS
jgi:hypothetical protein